MIGLGGSDLGEEYKILLDPVSYGDLLKRMNTMMVGFNCSFDTMQNHPGPP